MVEAAAVRDLQEASVYEGKFILKKRKKQTSRANSFLKKNTPFPSCTSSSTTVFLAPFTLVLFVFVPSLTVATVPLLRDSDLPR
jgi:hypothetical protein